MTVTTDNPDRLDCVIGYAYRTMEILEPLQDFEQEAALSFAKQIIRFRRSQRIKKYVTETALSLQASEADQSLSADSQ
jgi:hypothetical protein